MNLKYEVLAQILSKASLLGKYFCTLLCVIWNNNNQYGTMAVYRFTTFPSSSRKRLKLR